jgi:formylglycine-generating enzyme required for sulfatase activity
MRTLRLDTVMRQVNAVFPALCLVLCITMPGAALAADKTHTNSIGMEFALISAGSFVMGADPNFVKAFRKEASMPENSTPDYDWDLEFSLETPAHKATISRPFYLGKYTVTQDQWETVMGSNPSVVKGRNNPVENVSWLDAQEFIKRLNAKEEHTRYRLPTEAEWEYAAKAGTSTAYFFGNAKNLPEYTKKLSEYAWLSGNSEGTTHPVGQKRPNAWGLYDVYGNVDEWVQDWYGETYYADSPETDPMGPPDGEERVNRGGNWGSLTMECRSGYRISNPPDTRSYTLGVRLALSLE